MSHLFYLFSFLLLLQFNSFCFTQSGTYSPLNFINFAEVHNNDEYITNGECNFGASSTSSFPYGNVVAVNSGYYNLATECGKCYRLRCLYNKYQNKNFCSNQSVVVQVTDNCPYNPEDPGNNCLQTSSAVHFTINPQILKELTLPNTSAPNQFTVEYEQTNCTFNSNIMLELSSGVSEYYFSVLAYNVNGVGGIHQILIETNNGYAPLLREPYNYWTFVGQYPLNLPISLQIVAQQTGETLSLNNVITSITPSDIIDTGVQFSTLPNNDQYIYN
eukprot:TRINITY_DN3291_c0_g1_i1.p1 TRINITY_DN3291_c0_g1~~TRINITY_DN3291_c0_g1_i1.p1  ORF type:complete len:274 (+),score=60.66 TRINITY_DN3291_c0_g1_i1:1006-1827(+)